MTPASSPAPAAWNPQNLRDNPHLAPDKADRIQRMFAAIARSYDLNNRLHSFFRDQSWRRAAVRLANPAPADHVLDVATGTGDLALAFLRIRPAPASITAIDFTQPMLDVALHKLRRIVGRPDPTSASSLTGARPDASPSSPAPTLPPDSLESSPCTPPITFLRADALDLPFPAASFDILTIAFGLRNIQDPLRALAEFRRVLRPQARLIILEFSSPANPLIRACNALYCTRIMPITASLIARDRSGAYRYLPRSVQTFMSPADLAARLASLGFSNIASYPLTFGVCTVTLAHLP